MNQKVKSGSHTNLCSRSPCYLLQVLKACWYKYLKVFMIFPGKEKIQVIWLWTSPSHHKYIRANSAPSSKKNYFGSLWWWYRLCYEIPATQISTYNWLLPRWTHMEGMAQGENNHLPANYVTFVISTDVLWQSHTHGLWATLLLPACSYVISVAPEHPVPQHT